MENRNSDKADDKDAITLNSILEPAKIKLESLSDEDKPQEDSCLKILEKCLLNGSNVWNRDNSEPEKIQKSRKRKKDNRR